MEDNKQLLFNVEVYSDPDNESFAFNLGVNEEYHRIVLSQNCSLDNIVVSLLFAFIIFFCQEKYLDFDQELEDALNDYLKEESVGLTWDTDDADIPEET